MRTRDLQAVSRYWQRKLRLNEWRIEVRFAKKGESTDAYAYTTWEPDTREAKVVVNRATVCRKMAQETNAALFWIKDSDDEILEATVRHELLHIVIDGHVPPTGKYCPHREYAINRLAEALK